MAALCFATVTGPFDGESDIAEALKPGHADFNPSTREYSVTGGDAGGTPGGFHYVWKKVTGDVTINADVRFSGAATGDQRSAALMIRQSLDPDAVYASAVLHGDGSSTLQYLPDAGANPKSLEIEGAGDLWSAVHLSLNRRGDMFTVSAGKMLKRGGPLPFSPPITLTMKGPVYVGLANWSHAGVVPETAVFGNVMVQALGTP